MSNANIIAVANPKGGVAKTTTVSAFASGLKRRGFKVLAIDLNPNGNLSDYFGVENNESITIYEVIKKEKVITAAIQSREICDIVPASNFLTRVDEQIYMVGMENCLATVLKPILNSYDYIIMDTAPSLGILTINALTAANRILIPSTASIFAALGIKRLSETISKVKEYCNESIEVSGILITRYNPRASINKGLRELINQYIHVPIYNTFIRDSVVVEEALGMRMDIYKYDKKSNVANDYEKFIDEFLESDDCNAQKANCII